MLAVRLPTWPELVKRDDVSRQDGRARDGEAPRQLPLELGPEFRSWLLQAPPEPTAARLATPGTPSTVRRRSPSAESRRKIARPLSLPTAAAWRPGLHERREPAVFLQHRGQVRPREQPRHAVPIKEVLKRGVAQAANHGLAFRDLEGRRTTDGGERERTRSHALTATTMTGALDQRRLGDAKPNGIAATATFERKLGERHTEIDSTTSRGARRPCVAGRSVPIAL